MHLHCNFKPIFFCYYKLLIYITCFLTYHHGSAFVFSNQPTLSVLQYLKFMMVTFLWMFYGCEDIVIDLDFIVNT